MARYADVDVPSVYWISATTYRCKACDRVFDWRWAEGGELVKFVAAGTDEERWLPTFGKGGYLELLERIVPGFSRDQEIGVRVAKQFRQAFSSLQEKSSNGSEFVVDERAPTCPQCGGGDVEIVAAKVETNPPARWLRYRDPGGS